MIARKPQGGAGGGQAEPPPPTPGAQSTLATCRPFLLLSCSGLFPLPLDPQPHRWPWLTLVASG